MSNSPKNSKQFDEEEATNRKKKDEDVKRKTINENDGIAPTRLKNEEAQQTEEIIDNALPIIYGNSIHYTTMLDAMLNIESVCVVQSSKHGFIILIPNPNFQCTLSYDPRIGGNCQDYNQFFGTLIDQNPFTDIERITNVYGGTVFALIKKLTEIGIGGEIPENINVEATRLSWRTMENENKEKHVIDLT